MLKNKKIENAVSKQRHHYLNKKTVADINFKLTASRFVPVLLRLHPKLKELKRNCEQNQKFTDFF